MWFNHANPIWLLLKKKSISILTQNWLFWANFADFFEKPQKIASYRARKLVLTFCLLCWKSTTRFQNKPHHQIKTRILAAEKFWQFTVAELRFGYLWKKPKLKKLNKVRIDSIPCSTETYLPKFFLPPFDGRPPLKSPFDHRQQNK